MNKKPIKLSVVMQWNSEICKHCNACVTVCELIQKVNALRFENNILKCDESKCTYCGQCLSHCPVNALFDEVSNLKAVKKAISKGKYVVAQIAPAVRASFGEFYGMIGENVKYKIAEALKKVGFREVYDINLGADITALEEAHEFLEFKNENKTLFSSCCPAWVLYAKHFYPEVYKNLSLTKSPHLCLGSLIKHHLEKEKSIRKKDVFVVSIMPCTAKKHEIKWSSAKTQGIKDVDAVLTTRDLYELFKEHNIDFTSLKGVKFDELSIYSGGAAVFGRSGGVSLAIMRSIYEILTGSEYRKGAIKIKEKMIKPEVKEIGFFVKDKRFKICVVYGLGNVVEVLNKSYDFVEVMACPYGCIGGGGQPKSFNPAVIAKRREVLDKEDEGLIYKAPTSNPLLKELYGKYSIKPGNDVARKMFYRLSKKTR